MRRAKARPEPVFGPPAAFSAARRSPTPGQIAAAAGLAAALTTGALNAPISTFHASVGGLWSVFLFVSLWKVAACLLPRPSATPLTTAGPLPRYTVVAALRHEAGMVRQLVDRLDRLDYPRDRLEGFLVLEADDAETRAAALATPLPAWLSVIVAPPGHPRTKPRALNIALNHASGDLITVYDAEDEPAPGQLREAAARFARSGPATACLQAPLRIRRLSDTGRTPFIDRQFAAEYAALFEVVLPAMARLDLPFPLGGTSNHFRTAVLRKVGGWDPWNVTEDADLGFRLWCEGWRLGVLTSPTWETPPGDLRHWLPQRTRWIKGYMQTWGVHMRRPWKAGLRGMLALQLSLGVAIVSAMLNGLTLAWLTTTLLIAATSGATPVAPWPALTTLLAGVVAAWLTCLVGARRANVDYGLADMLGAPAYWAMQSLAFVHAAWRLVVAPHAWDKTPHVPEDAPETEPVAELDFDMAGRRAA